MSPSPSRLDAGFYGEFVDVREERDYAYHVNYTKERQLWQDKVIKRVVSRTEPQPQDGQPMNVCSMLTPIGGPPTVGGTPVLHVMPMNTRG